MRFGKVWSLGKSLGKTALFLLLLFGLFLKAEQILKLDMGHRGTDNVNGFYAEEENSVEVLFIGSSRSEERRVGKECRL